MRTCCKPAVTLSRSEVPTHAMAEVSGWCDSPCIRDAHHMSGPANLAADAAERELSLPLSSRQQTTARLPSPLP